jgi:hypothetical protein
MRNTHHRQRFGMLQYRAETGINMMLQPQSQLSYQLGRANAADDATNSVTDVAGNLTLNAVTPSGERN